MRRVCGAFQYGQLGVDEEGYREDWALIKLRDGFVGKNGTWWEKRFLGKLRIQWKLVRPETEFTGKVVSFEDPALGTSDVWFKDGATTGWTAGTLISTEVHLFLKGTTFGITESEGIHPANIERAKVHTIKEMRGGTFATGGDSGSGVFKLTQDGRDFVFGAMVLSSFTLLVRSSLTMGVPATRVLAQVSKATGVEWAVAD